MRTIEIKSKINEVLDDVLENSLPEIWNILSQFQNKTSDHKKLMERFQKILLKDEALLQRLAQ